MVNFCYNLRRKSNFLRTDKEEEPGNAKYFSSTLRDTTPYIKTSVGAQFIRLVERHFPEGSELSKYFNTQNLKVSYSNMPNFDRIIKAHNKRILNPEKVLKIQDCDCAAKGKVCCLSGNCNTKSLVYKGEVKYKETNPRTNLEEEKCKFYLGLTENTFFERHKLHKTSFNNPSYSGSTSLSSFVWELKRLRRRRLC